MAIGRTTALALTAAFVIVLGSAGVYLTASKPSGTAKVSVYVKDVPGDWTYVNVTFSEVRIHTASADDESGWYNLTLQKQTIDLASLTNVSELLASGSVNAGKYTQIRIVVLSATGTMANGTLVNFTVPSGELRTTHPFNVTAGHSDSLTLDIDLAHSIIQDGPGWKFKPVLGSVTQG